MYLEFDEFLMYGGDEMDYLLYERLEYKAEKLVDAVTFSRISDEKPVRESVKRCVYELICLLKLESETDARGLGVSSMSNDGVSVNFGTASTSREVKSRAVQIISDYLRMETDSYGTPLMFRGVV